MEEFLDKLFDGKFIQLQMVTSSDIKGQILACARRTCAPAYLLSQSNAFTDIVVPPKLFPF